MRPGKEGGGGRGQKEKKQENKVEGSKEEGEG